MRPDFLTGHNPVTNPHALFIRAAILALAALIGLMVWAVPALSAEGTAGPAQDSVTVRQAPLLVPTTAAAEPATELCVALLRAPAPVGGRSAAPHRPQYVMPTAIIGMITGVSHVTGPREQAAAFSPDDAAASLDGRNARAIAAYRKCRAEATLSALSN